MTTGEPSENSDISVEFDVWENFLIRQHNHSKLFLIRTVQKVLAVNMFSLICSFGLLLCNQVYGQGLQNLQGSLITSSFYSALNPRKVSLSKSAVSANVRHIFPQKTVISTSVHLCLILKLINWFEVHSIHSFMAMFW